MRTGSRGAYQFAAAGRLVPPQAGRAAGYDRAMADTPPPVPPEPGEPPRPHAAADRVAVAGGGSDTAEDRARRLGLALAEGRPIWQRMLWVAAGVLALALGIVGIFLPLLPTTPLVLLAAFCFARGSTRCERWLLTHPRFGPMIRDWRLRRAIPRRVKHLAWAMMALGSAIAAWVLPARVAWLPAACCLAVALWMARLPD